MKISASGRRRRPSRPNLIGRLIRPTLTATVVHWDQKPAGGGDATGNAGPYSVTKVMNDLSSSTSAENTSSDSNRATLALVLSIAALH
ncbi:MAG: hypothetical protein WDN27_04880 [Candidatus Saccharibacteria bacterium]